MVFNKYRKVASSSLSRLVAHPSIFRMFMKGKFDAYVLWPLTKSFQNWIVDLSTARDFTVIEIVKVDGTVWNPITDSKFHHHYAPYV